MVNIITKSFANKLTIFRIVLAPITLFFLMTSNYVYALLLLLLGALTDYLDGYVARRYRQESQIGGILDPIADKVLIIPCLIFFVCTRLLNPYLVAILVIRDIAVTLIRLQDLRKHEIYDKANNLGKIKTVLGFVILSLAMLVHIFDFSLIQNLLVPIVNSLLLLAVVLSLSGSLKFLKHSRV